MSRPETAEFTLPAGTYRVGDPSYSVPDMFWMQWLEDSYKAAGTDFMGEGHSPVGLLAPIEGKPVLGSGTAYGDGHYVDQFGVGYAVDAGLIGLVPTALDGLKDSWGPAAFQVVTFSEDIVCRREADGTLHFGHIVIVTGYDNEDADDNYGLDEDEDGDL